MSQFTIRELEDMIAALDSIREAGRIISARAWGLADTLRREVMRSKFRENRSRYASDE